MSNRNQYSNYRGFKMEKSVNKTFTNALEIPDKSKRVSQIIWNKYLFLKLLSLKDFGYNVDSFDSLVECVSGIFPPIAFVLDYNAHIRHFSKY